MNRCRTCGQEVLWAVTEHGRSVPLDPEPRPDGNIELVHVGGVFVARVLTDERRVELEQELLAAARAGETPRLRLHVTHFATCPQADTHRRRRAQTTAGGAA